MRCKTSLLFFITKLLISALRMSKIHLGYPHLEMKFKSLYSFLRSDFFSIMQNQSYSMNKKNSQGLGQKPLLF